MAQTSTHSDSTVLKKADEIGDDIRKAATNAAGRVEEIATAQFDRVETAIRRNPVAAVGIAAGVGFFLAILARRQ
jgi:ElaB/YqjD/DUF883 family membrane-anchored ribosome-binding protein